MRVAYSRLQRDGGRPAPLPRRAGSWGNDNSPGASSYTYATLFDVSDPDELAEFTLRVQHLESQPEFDDQPDDSSE